MSLIKDAQGPGNLVPHREFRQFKAGEAITKGLLVGFDGTTGYTVKKANITTIKAIGVATETVASGGWFSVQIAGHCEYLTNDGTDIVAADYLVADANAKAVPKTSAELDPDSTGGGLEWHVFGQSLEAETGTTCTNVMLFKQV